MSELIDLRGKTLKPVLKILLQDKTTKQPILFAAEDRAERGADYGPEAPMTEEKLLREDGPDSVLPRTRVEKAMEVQRERTRKKAEVFTPAWLVNRMNNFCDVEWFGREEVFNREDGQDWVPNPERVSFPEGKSWQRYVDSRRLEITCGEAPFIVSRYDSATGERIPPEKRVGVLDRKLRVVSENAVSDAEWLRWTERAFQSVYGYEFQGDSLLLARANLLLSFAEYYEARFGAAPEARLLRKFANIISWNFWQMDGLSGYPPFTEPKAAPAPQLSLFDLLEPREEPTPAQPCRLKNWRWNCAVSYEEIHQGGKKMKWDFAIGNPPYQESADEDSGNQSYAAPVYHHFLDEAYRVADRVELIHPARFLFNAGSTPEAWNQKMLNDPHFKVLDYQENTSNIFNNVEIKGG